MLPSIRPPSTAASPSVPPEAAPEGATYEEDADRPFHAVARAARSCWHSTGHLALYLAECGSPVFGFCIRLYGICYLVETVNALEQQRKIQPLRYFTFIGSRDPFRRTFESSFVEQGLHGVQYNSNLPAALRRVLLPPVDKLVHKGSPRAQVT